ncbi:hypothetical protein BWG23_02765 [Flavobacterium oreochromis]|nr:hypothetical protein BWG23_02765 [Flavobacterium oreochromis]
MKNKPVFYESDVRSNLIINIVWFLRNKRIVCVSYLKMKMWLMCKIYSTVKVSLILVKSVFFDKEEGNKGPLVMNKKIRLSKISI